MLNYSAGKRLLFLCDELFGMQSDDFISQREAILAHLLKQQARISKTRLFAEYGVSASQKHYKRMLARFVRCLEKVAPEDYHDSVQQLKREVESCAERRVKIVFLLHESQVFPSIESVYEAASNDLNMDTTIVYAPLGYGRRAWKNSAPDFSCNDTQRRIVELKRYSFLHESPDVIVITRPYLGEDKKAYVRVESDLFELIDVEASGFRTVYLPYAFYDTLSERAIQFGYQQIVPSNAWRIVAYSQQILDNYKTYSSHKGERAALLGAPRFDISSGVNGYRKDAYTEEYAAKIRGRQTLFWNPHFNYSYRDPAIYLAYLARIFDFFKQNTNLFLFWRPHPVMFDYLVQKGVMTRGAVNEMIADVRSMENALIDDSKDYINAFALSNAMLTDGDSSLPYEYIATEKPVFIHYIFGFSREVWEQKYEKNMPRLYYPSFNNSDLDKTLELFAAGEDPEKEWRLEAAKKFVYMNDGHTGERVKNYVLEELVSSERELASSFVSGSDS